MFVIVIGKIVGIAFIADNKELHETEQGICKPIPRIIFIIDNLLNCSFGRNLQRLQFNLHNGNTIDKNHHIISMVTIFCVNTELIDHFILVFAPVVCIYKGVLQRRIIIPFKCVCFP